MNAWEKRTAKVGRGWRRMSNRSLTPAWSKRSQDTWGAQGDSGGKNAGTRKSAAVLSITKRADGAGPGGGCLRGMKQQCHWKEGHGSPPPTHPSWPTTGGRGGRPLLLGLLRCGFAGSIPGGCEPGFEPGWFSLPFQKTSGSPLVSLSISLRWVPGPFLCPSLPGADRRGWNWGLSDFHHMVEVSS